MAAGAADRVTIRGLDFNGLGASPNGIRFISGAALVVDRCIIYGFTNGIEVALTNVGGAEVKDTLIVNNTGDGIKVDGTAVAGLAADHVTISGSTNGVELATPSIGTVSNSLVSGNGAGAVASAGGAILNVDNTRLVGNGTGASASVSGATIALSNDSLYANNTAVNAVAGSIFATGQNNKLFDNNSNGATPNTNMITE